MSEFNLEIIINRIETARYYLEYELNDSMEVEGFIFDNLEYDWYD